jgi:large subunit ribosomal protein L21
MYALIEINGKQYRAEKDSIIRVDRFENVKGDKLVLDKVLMVGGDKEVKIGTPYVAGVKVDAVVQDQIKDKKVLVYKYKRRKRERRSHGHRQQYTLLKVGDITGA